FVLDAHPWSPYRGVLLPTFGDGLAEFTEEVPAGHLGQVMARHPWGGLQVGARPPTELEDVQVMVDEHAAGGIVCHDDAVGFLMPIRRRRGGWGSAPGAVRPCLVIVLGSEVRVLPRTCRLLHIDPVFVIDHAKEVGER